MRSRSRNSRKADRFSRLVAVTALFAVAACAAASDAPEIAAPVGFSAPDRVIAGPQGRVGQFVVECEFDRFQPDDPIVHPSDPGGSHLHQFFGAVGVTADSEYDELTGRSTTCGQRLDTASYWTPTLVSTSGEPIEPTGAVGYYRAGPDIDPVDVVPYPPGFMMVAGDHAASEAQDLAVVAFGCGTGVARHVMPVDCGNAHLRLWITFQDCWNGVDLRSPIVSEPQLHVSYSAGGECPADFPVSIPQLQLAVEFPLGLDPEGLQLSSGTILTGHADFWNTWDQDKLVQEVEQCIHRDLPCGISG